MRLANVVIWGWLLLFVYSELHGEESGAGNPVEIGVVKWGRDFPGALEKSRESGKPIFLLFQEVPGCIGCQNFGEKVLTYPLLVEAIEDLFIPVLVYNNRAGGRDAELMKLYKEPSWNFQVIRFLDGDGEDIIPRKDKIWTIAGVAKRMIAALQAAGRGVPHYLQMVALEDDLKNISMAGFAMACFWTGEYKLGKIDGVVRTEAGWYDNREITLVWYHNQMIELGALVAAAKNERCAQAIYLEEMVPLDRSRFVIKMLELEQYQKAKREDQKKQLQLWLERQKGLELTPMQLTKLNSVLPDDRKQAEKWLSPRQISRVRW